MADLVEVTDETFEDEVNQSELPVLIDFWAEWCGPCKMVAPIVEAIAAKYAGKLKVVKCNVEDAPNAATKHNIRAIPTLAVVKDGKVAEVMVGVQTEGDLSSTIDGVLAE